MILHEITGTEQHPVYQTLEAANASRQFDFLASIVQVSLAVDKCFLSSAIIKALNFHAITCLHTNAGEYRPCRVEIRTGDVINYVPPDHFRVGALMDDFVNTVNRIWDSADPIVLAAFVLWRVNLIHPFINGNGRTARAACYFVLCVKAGAWLPGVKLLPELLHDNREEYVEALKRADESAAAGQLDLSVLVQLIQRLLLEQFNGAVNGNHAAATQPQAATPVEAVQAAGILLPEAGADQG